jgi:hypothetical protein
MRKLVVLAIIVLAAGPAMAQMSWNFDDGLQGWTIVNSGTNIGSWVAPGSGPLLYSDGLGTDIYSQAGGGNVYLPGDGNGKTTALFDLSGVLVGGKTQSYTLQADVYIPNLRPLNFRYNYPGMLNQYSGIAAYAVQGGVNNDWGTTLGGNLTQGGQTYIDYTSDAFAKRTKSWIMEDESAAPSYDAMWNQWITLKIDWNYTTPGQVIASAYIPWKSPVTAAPGWVDIYNAPIEPSTWQPRPVDINRIGLGSYLKGETPWSKSQIDNVIFNSPDLIPEPSSILLLSLAVVGLVGRKARK